MTKVNLKQIFDKVQRLYADLSSSRGLAKWALFYLFFGLLFLLHAYCSIHLHLQMLRVTPTNSYFNFKATEPDATGLWSPGCSVMSYPAAVHRGFFPMVANYILLSWFVLGGGVVSFATALSSLVLFLGFYHFRSLPQHRLRKLGLWEKLIGMICKTLPGLMNFGLGVLVCGVAILSVLVAVFNVCDERVGDLNGELFRVQNCRRWVEECVKDTSRYGRHLECSLPANYNAFPAELCQKRDCIFPQSSIADTVVTLKSGDDICSGERVSKDHGGPVPFCPTCKEARRDKTSGVYIPDLGAVVPLSIDSPDSIGLGVSVRPRSRKSRLQQDQSGRSPAPLQGSNITAAALAVAGQKKQGLENSATAKTDKAEAEMCLIPSLTFQNPADAFNYAYMEAITFFKEGSSVTPILLIYVFASGTVIFLYMVAGALLSMRIQPDGYFVFSGTSKTGFGDRFLKWIHIA